MCGIFGHLTLKEKKKFDFSLFTTLGINNDSRGGDACGIFIDGQVEYGTTKETKYFQDFFLGSKLLFDTEEFNIALGHCRKASPGIGLEPEKAQPVVLRKEKTGEVLFVMIHNGTIYNYKELAKEYIPGIKIDGLSDSQVMARIFYYKGYECLSKYRGGSVFVIVDYRQPTPRVLMFKGASKKTEYATTITEERPLYVSIGKDDLVFSSIDSYLPAFRPDIEVLTIEENTLVQYKNNNLYVVKKYDRSKMCQAKPSVVKYEDNYYSGWNYGKTDYYTPTTYATYEKDLNIYKAESTPIHGSRWVGKYGKCNKKQVADSIELWFFHGVLLKNQECFKFLEEYQKKTRQSPTDFFTKNQNLIRFLSVDRLYFKNGSLVMATQVYLYKAYTGKIEEFTSNSEREFNKGQYVRSDYAKDKDPFEFIKSDKPFDITKLRKKLCS